MVGKWGWHGLGVGLLCIGSVLGGGQQAFASIPLLGLTPAISSKPASTGEASLSSQRAAVTRQLEALVQQRLSPNRAAIFQNPDEAFEYQRSLEYLTQLLEERRKLLTELETEKQATPLTKDNRSMLSQFQGKPPYSVLDVDKLRDEYATLQERVQSQQSNSQALEAEISNLLQKKQKAEEQLRLASDALARAAQGAARENAQANHARLTLRVRMVEAELANTALRRDILTATLRTLRTQEEHYPPLIDRVRFSLTMTAADLEQQRALSLATRDRLNRELEALTLENTARQHEREKLTRSLSPDKNAPLSTELPPPDEAKMRLRDQARLRLLNTEMESDRVLRQLLTGLETLEQYVAQAWEHRFTVLSATADTADRRKAIAAMLSLSDSIGGRERFSHDQLELARGDVREQKLRLEMATVGSTAHTDELEILASLQRRVDALERGDVVVTRFKRQLDRWLDNHRSLNENKPLFEKWADWAEAGKRWVRAVWNIELFSVEDATEVDGKQVSVSYGITAGKVTAAILWFLGSYGLLSWFSLRAQRMLVTRFAVDEAVARVLRRWLMISVAVLLLVLVLNLARIPLTAFAFMGGALAIGVGFGTQTIIKNLISGVILLFERKIRVGDIIEVGGITGTVSSIDLRASTVRSVDGIETLVPNSTLLENQVTNWTYTNARIRRVVKVGVAYGTDLNQAVELMAYCAAVHPQTLDDPAPEVLFEDFADSALNLSLYYWVELNASVRGVKVDSDVRFAVHDAFATHGIQIPFPQMDVYLKKPAAAAPLSPVADAITP